MDLYFEKTFTASASGSVIRPVSCERCANEYFYELARVGIGRGSAPYYLGQRSAAARADRAAQKDLAKKLRTDHETVPCPHCGWVQPEMIRALRRRRLRWLLWVVVIAEAAVLPGIAFVALMNHLNRPDSPFPAADYLGWAILAVVTGGALLSVRAMVQRRIDPNQGYPQHPSPPFPGAPPALLRLVDETGAGHYAPADDDFAAKAVGGDGFADVQLQRCEFPPHCCVCLGPPQRVFQTPLADESNLSVPMCAACHRRMVWRWWKWAAVSVVIGAAIGAVPALLVPKIDELGRWLLFGIVALFGAVFAVALIPKTVVKPYRLKTLDGQRGVVRLSFTNREYTHRLAHSYAQRQTVVVDPEGP